MKRSWLPAVIVFAGALALGNFVLGPLYCRVGFEIPYFNRAAMCVAQTGLTHSASALYYFLAVGVALFVGIIFDKLPRRTAAVAVVAAKPAAATEPVEPAAVVALTPSVAAIPDAAAKTESPAPVAAAPAPTPAPTPDPTPAPEAPRMDLAAMVEAALKANQPAPKPTPALPPVPKPTPTPVSIAPASTLTPMVAPTPVITSTPSLSATSMPPAPVLPPPAKPVPHVKPWQKSKPFDGTNEELIARIKELGKAGGVESIAAAQRNLDESTLSALGGGIDPKHHLSQIAHLLLMDDPELKSDVARGVVVHIAARLKELGVVNGPGTAPV